MKNFLILLVVVALSAKAWFWFQKRAASTEQEVLDFSKPVYAEIRTTMTAGGREIEQVALIKTANAQDCAMQTNRAIEKIMEGAKKNQYAVSLTQTKSCQDHLAPHLASTFDNKPSSDFTYASVDRNPGAVNERDVRVIYFGVTAAESDMVCDLALGMGNANAKVTCIRPVR